MNKRQIKKSRINDLEIENEKLKNEIAELKAKLETKKKPRKKAE